MPKPLKAFCKKHKISFECEQHEKRADGHMDDMARHWKCWLVREVPGLGKIGEEFWFSQGSAHKKPPTLEDLLGSLQLDVRDVADGIDFESWARELGYDTDSRQAEKIYKACKNSLWKLRQVMHEALPEFLELDLSDY